MPVSVKHLRVNVDKESRGFEIQGMQKGPKDSDLFDDHDVRDIVLQTIRPHKKRGNHYHTNKTEWFLPIRGFAVLSWSDIGGTDPLKGTELMITDFQNPKLFEIHPNTCHIVENKSEEDFYMLSFASNFDIDLKNNPKC